MQATNQYIKFREEKINGLDGWMV